LPAYRCSTVSLADLSLNKSNTAHDIAEEFSGPYGQHFGILHEWLYLFSCVTSLKLNIEEYENCLKTNKYAQEVSSDSATAAKLGVIGVPGFIIGSWDAKTPTKVKGISFIRGAVPFIIFQQEIDKAIASFLPKNASKS
jgi:hypothetical protein